MAHPLGNRRDTDTIDLTLSSPEPEPRPSSKEQIRVPPQQPQPYSTWPPSVSRVRQESGHLPRIKPEPGQPSRVQKNPSKQAPSSRTPVALQTRQIHPSHLHAIISTASPHALQKVVLELCRVSPALSGALVRGLAPYSTSAQNMINQHRIHSPQPVAVAQDDEDSDFLYESFRLNSGLIPHNPQRKRLPGQSLGNHTSQARQHHSHTFQSASQAEYQPYRPSTPSSDGELRRPGPSAQKVRPNSTRTPLQNLPKDSSTISRTSDTVTRPMAAVQKTAAKTCVKCHEPFSDYSEPCIYHPGRKIKKEDGSVVWSCCEEDMLSVGCDFGGNHTDAHT